MKIITDDGVEIEFDKIKIIESKGNEVIILITQKASTDKVIILEEGVEIVNLDSTSFYDDITKAIKNRKIIVGKNS